MAVEAISKRLRFEIFKRDAFTCAYCGRTPPAAILQVDHILARAKGGTNESSNLITSCSDCNLGKSDRSLEDVLPHLRPEAVDEMRERVEQMRAYREWRAEYDNELRLELDQVWQAWIDEFGGYLDEIEGVYRSEVTFPTDRAVLELLETLPLSEILAAVRATSRRYHARGPDRLYASAAPRYFYGVCRNKARLADEQRRRVRISWDDLAELMPELADVHIEVAQFNPADSWHFCGQRLWSHGWNVLHDDYRQEVAPPPERIAALTGPRSINARDPLLGTQTAHDVAVRAIRAVVPACGQTCRCGRPKRPVREEDYPRCRRCGQISEPIDRRESCEPMIIIWNDIEHEPVPYGFESWLQQSKIAENWGRYRRLKEPTRPVANSRCTSCRAPLGGYHHADCGEDACAICGERDGTCARRDHQAPVLSRSLRQSLAIMKRISASERQRASAALPA